MGSSLNVYPAAGLINYAPAKASLWLIDPNDVEVPVNRHVEIIKEKAGLGVDILSISFVRTIWSGVSPSGCMEHRAWSVGLPAKGWLLAISVAPQRNPLPLAVLSFRTNKVRRNL